MATHKKKLNSLSCLVLGGIIAVITTLAFWLYSFTLATAFIQYYPPRLNLIYIGYLVVTVIANIIVTSSVYTIIKVRLGNKKLFFIGALVSLVAMMLFTIIAKPGIYG